jgi:hypothetical protein
MDVRSPKGPGSARKTAPMKKVYVAPAIVTWGTLRDMTRHVGNQGHQDGGKTKKFTKTR